MGNWGFRLGVLGLGQFAKSGSLCPHLKDAIQWGLDMASKALALIPNLEGQGDLVSRLIVGITRVTL